jgi:hypothetical protein
MAILTTAECKTILQISASTWDTAIAAMIPYVQEDICDFCNTFFRDGYIYRYSGSELVITRGTTGSAADKITDAGGYFAARGFLAGDDIAIEGGYSNVGIYTLATVDASTLTLTSTKAVRTQDPSSTGTNYLGTILVSRVKWPKGIKLLAAKMVWHLIDKPKPSGIQSERVDDYSVTYAGGHEYPAEIIAGLKRFRKVSLK